MSGGKAFGVALSFRPYTTPSTEPSPQYKFNQIKVQVLELANESREVQKAASELFLHLVVAEFWRHNGMAVIRDADIAGLKGWSCDKVSRAVHQLVRAGFIAVDRGRWSRATEYRLSEWVWAEATQRRKNADKITDFSKSATLQKRDHSSAEMPTKTQQKRPLTKETQKTNLEEQLLPQLVPLSRKFQIKQWTDCLAVEGFGQLSDVLPLISVEGVEGFWLPALWPANENTERRSQQMTMLRSWIENNDDGELV
ncbi:MAG: hypothetical protein JJU15_20420 [Pararhodobacter sp.]|nr:hypothetical protein [Pararhodobacter sp.]